MRPARRDSPSANGAASGADFHAWIIEGATGVTDA
jgi:hypothetical protein